MEYCVSSDLTPAEQKKLVLESDKAFESEASRKVSALSDIPDLKIIGLTGPSCSGKTTAANKLIEHLQKSGRQVVVVSLDNFLKDVETVRRQGAAGQLEELDFDSEDAMDLDLLECTVESLLLSRPTVLPIFDFKTGKLNRNGSLLTPTVEDVFLFEGIQVLYPGVDKILSRVAYKSIYISPESPIVTGGEHFDPNEIRLMRRIVRDYRHRDSSAEFTLFLWKGVRENEERAIFPFRDRCSEAIDSTLAYEVGMLKPYLLPLLENYNPDALFFKEAKALLQKLKNVQPIPADYLTQNSLYKEFI